MCRFCFEIIRLYFLYMLNDNPYEFIEKTDAFGYSV